MKTMDEYKIKRMVSRVVRRTLGMPGTRKPAPRRRLVTEMDIHEVPPGESITVPKGSLITPLARQVAMERKVKILIEGERLAVYPVRSVPVSSATGDREKVIALGADHAGYELKEQLKSFLSGLGYPVTDCGTDSSQSVDYPDFAFAVAQLVAQGQASRGIIVDGAGIGSCMAANKVTGIRAATCYDQASAINSREHNDANVLCLGAGLIGANLAQQIAQVWLETGHGGGRHARRVGKIMDIERRYRR
jgi:ribose 5-phosphate isomerase B